MAKHLGHLILGPRNILQHEHGSLHFLRMYLAIAQALMKPHDALRLHEPDEGNETIMVIKLLPVSPLLLLHSKQQRP